MRREREREREREKGPGKLEGELEDKGESALVIASLDRAK